MRGRCVVARARCLVASSRGLLVQRDRDGVYSIPGGRLEFGETLPSCAIRELREESGLRVFPQRLVYVVEFLGRRGGRRRHEILYYFKCSYEGEPRSKWPNLVFEWREPVELRGRFWPEPLLDYIVEDYPDFDIARFIVIVDSRISFINTIHKPLEASEPS